MRLFVAVRPPENVLEHAADALAAVVGAAGHDGRGPIRWTPPENRHVTLGFYGEVPDGLLDEVAGRVSDVAGRTAPLILELRGAGVFSGRTLWLGVAGEVDALVALGRQVVRIGEDLTGRRDERPRSRPHMTVGRIRVSSTGRHGRHRDAAGPLTSMVRALALYQGPAWTVDRVHLVRSEPGRGRSGGPLYTDLAGPDLGAGPVGAD
ncbi:RNA 2',3'-cyclic phosphodiesterase [Cellulomonas bogoriensis]|uniref:RNA 2',3'-cyclic phosphodiesterase n=1 Tax=Cellulomonas bogoriensis 69B4 = DSM 16987 TaxID=1386082 RepID=A0A0A0BTL9_9CELL|nr:RNA 2',3'-cyclic phosphodiesterase [Cellulomonas bogoriensis]KGM11251.1 2'-5' RNA ligase [Cellulomonas bogoriensis 69B4 = DSM 16987]